MSDILIDNCGRREGLDRRHFSYSIHIPERRSGRDRRNRKDRRSELGLKREELERRNCFKKIHSG